jgi:hypothetical protein
MSKSFYAPAVLLSGILTVVWVTDAAAQARRRPSPGSGACSCACVSNDGRYNNYQSVGSLGVSTDRCEVTMGRNCKIRTPEGEVSGKYRSCEWTAGRGPGSGQLSQPPGGVAPPQPSRGHPEGSLPGGGGMRR